MKQIFETEIETGDVLTCNLIDPLPGNDIAPKLRVAQDYVAGKVCTCQCGQKHIDVGLISTVNFVRCYRCNLLLPYGHVTHWCHPSRFTIKDKKICID